MTTLLTAGQPVMVLIHESTMDSSPKLESFESPDKAAAELTERGFKHSEGDPINWGNGEKIAQMSSQF